MCRNPKLWIALAVGAGMLALVGPSWAAVAPLLLAVACPLMMIVMMGGIAGMGRRRRAGADDGVDESSEVALLRAEVAELRQRVTH